MLRGLVLAAIFASVIAQTQPANAKENCKVDDIEIKSDLSKDQRVVWFLKDSAGDEDFGSGPISELASNKTILCEDAEFETIKLKHPEHGPVWIMRSGVVLSADDAVTCKAVAGSNDTMGTRGLGEGCNE